MCVYVCYHGDLYIMFCVRPFFRTVKERVEKYFKQNNIVSYYMCVSMYIPFAYVCVFWL